MMFDNNTTHGSINGGYQKPRKLVLELSHNCNLRCVMCGFGGKPIARDRFMDENLIERILSESAFLADIEEIRLNGRGESTIHPHFSAIIERVHGQFPRAYFSLFTNLMFPSDALLDTIKALDIEVYVSMDSVNETRFESIRKGARFGMASRRLEAIGRGFVVFTLQRDNVTDLVETGQFAARHCLGFIVNVIHVDDATYVADFSRLLDEHWASIMDQLRQLHGLYPRG
nr:radical SAM protein [Candidatus Sigynarchaeota archaeon]